MANEASLRISLQITSGNLNYQSKPTSFRADVAGKKGPVPGAFTASLAGTDVDFSQLTQPGLCVITNLDEDNFVEVGIYDMAITEFFPLMEILPGEFYVLRLSRYLGETLGGGSGTGTGGPTVTMRVKATGAPCNVVVEAFEV